MPLQKGKGSKNACNDYRGVSMLSMPGEVNGSLDRGTDGSN